MIALKAIYPSSRGCFSGWRGQIKSYSASELPDRYRSPPRRIDGLKSEGIIADEFASAGIR
jgi:hypothetical protein